ncbi:MAG TPA: histidinol-phosphate transaminase [Pyrinomonadaceae bacterium]|nr:histidinol-phosphate transaminase [Pyrinomonadaceae bacterium]
MADPLNIIKDQVRELRRYSLNAPRTRVKLNQNENPWDAPAQIKGETLRRLNELPWSRYPDFVPESLHQELAAFSGWTAEGVLAGNGSNELIQALLMVTVGRGKRVLISEPTFSLYRQITTVLDGEVISVPLTDELAYDIPALGLQIETTDPDVAIFCSPNNPTGCVLPKGDIESTLEASRGLVVVDEAYFEFSGQSAVSLLGRHENLVVLRTFSKAMALAGLRVGYLLAAPRVVDEVRKALLPYNLNVMSQAAASVAIERYESDLAPLVRQIIDERDRVYTEIAAIRGLKPVKSLANFMLVHSEIDPLQVFNELIQRDILVRDVSSYPMLRSFFRISIGTPTENDLLLAALRAICE